MSNQIPSPKIRPANYAILLDQIIVDQTLTSRQREEIASALRSAGKEFGCPLEELAAHPSTLRKRPASLMPGLANVDLEAFRRFKRRWANVRSLIRFALKHVGIIAMTGRSRVAFTPEWTALFRLVTGKYDRIALSRLARFCSVRGIDPPGVDDSIFQAFLEQLIADGIDRLPRKVQQKAAVMWNRLARREPTWPAGPVTIPDHRRTYTLPWSVFRASLKVEFDAWKDHQAGTDILAEMDFPPLVPASIKTRTHQFRAYISALVHKGLNPQTFHGLRDVVAVETVKTGVRFFLDRASGGSTEQAFNIVRVITSIARHWVRVDPPHLKALQKVCKRINPGYQGMSEKNRARLAQFDDPANLRKLHELPALLVAIASAEKRPSRAGALLVQTAVAIDLLLMLPIRRKNLADLEFDRHLIRSGAATRIFIPGHEVKNHVEIDAILPPHLTRLIDLYRTSYRPLLLTEPSDCLFPGVADRPKSPERLASQISNCIKDRCGLLMNVHLFRHLSAQTWLETHPGDYGLVRLLLGHKSVVTTTRFYCGMETKAAVLHFDEHVLHLRESLAKPATPDQPGLGR
jgi:integrase